MRTLVLSALLLVSFSVLASTPLTFEEVDTDGDGLISADEAASVEGLDFNAADSDNDGTLTVDEYEIAVEGLSPPAAASATEPSAPETPPSPAKPPVAASPSGQTNDGALAPAPHSPPTTSAPSATGDAAPTPVTPPAAAKP